MTEKQYRLTYVETLAALAGSCAEGGENHRRLIEAYNSLDPLPRGVKMTESYDWCACTVTALAVICGMTEIFALECSCTKQIEQWKAKGRWIEDDGYVPQTGDLIYYCWSDSGSGDCVSLPDHVGVVESVSDGILTVLEGNRGNNVGRRYIAVNGRYIRGFASPDYGALVTEEKKEEIGMKNYAAVTDMPEAYREAVAELVNEGSLKGYGDERGLGLSEELARFITIWSRHDKLKTEELLDKISDRLIEKLIAAWKGGEADGSA